MRKSALIVALTLVGVLAELALGGCGGPDLLIGSGERAPAPAGFLDYCNRHPDRAECGGTQ